MTDNLKNILVENNLHEYISIFEENKLSDTDIISELSESDLEKIGITALGDRKKILKIFSKQIYDVPNSPEVIVKHATMKGDDASTGFGKGFGETVGKKIGGCVWSIIVLAIIVIIIAMILNSI